MPWIVFQAIGPQHVEGVRQHVHESGGEDDSGRKGLDDDEEASIRVQGFDGTGEEGQADSDHACDEDGDDGDDLEGQSFCLVVAGIFGHRVTFIGL